MAYKVTRRKITDYTPDTHNANAGTERGAGMLEDSLRKVGAGRSLTADAHGRIPAGNKTLQAAVDAGFEDVIEIETDGKALIVHRRSDWDLDDPNPNNPARQYAYLDNRVSEVSLTWDAAQIAADIEAGMDLSHIFTQPELEALEVPSLDESVSDPEPQLDRAEELLAKWQVARGDLWQIGNHRLLCGDSTNADDVARVMDGEKADMVFTDPPYNVASENDLIASTVSKAMSDLKNAEWDKDFQLQPVLDCLLPVIGKDCTVYICTSHHLAPTIWNWMAKWATHHSWCVWQKPNPMPSLMKRHWTWSGELIAYATRGKHIFNFPSVGHAFSIWEFTKHKETEHPTEKPVEVPSHAISHSSNAGQIVYDPFGGSGTTMVACEQLSRQCRMIEIEPKYVSVILERMAAMGLEPHKAS